MEVLACTEGMLCTEYKLLGIKIVFLRRNYKGNPYFLFLLFFQSFHLMRPSLRRMIRINSSLPELHHKAHIKE